MSDLDRHAVSPDRVAPPGQFATGLRINVKTMLVLVATAGAILAAWRTIADLDPLTVAMRQMRVGGVAERRQAIYVIVNSARANADVLFPLLAQETEDADPEIRGEAIAGLLLMLDFAKSGTNGTRAARVRFVMDTAIKGVDDGDAGVRILAMHVLGQLLAEAKNPNLAVAALTGALAAPEPDVRARAATVLGTCGSFPGVVPPEALVRAVDDPSADVRKAAALALPRFEQGFEPILPALLRAIAGDPDLGRECPRALLGRVPNTTAVPSLIAALSSPSWRVRSLSATLLGMIGPAANEAVPELLAALKQSIGDEPISDTPESVRIWGIYSPVRTTAEALAAVGAGPEFLRREVVPPLVAAARSCATCPRFEAIAAALSSLGPLAEPAVPDLIAVVTSENVFREQFWAAEALVEITVGTDAAGMALDAIERANKKNFVSWDDDRYPHPPLKRLRAAVAKTRRDGTKSDAQR
jgi:HEAT repeat protein